MAGYDIGPFWVRVNYAVGSTNHVHQFGVEPYGSSWDVGTAPSLVQNDDTEVAADVGIAAYCAVLKGALSQNSVITGWDMFMRANVGDPPVWIDSGVIVGGQGTWNAPEQPAGMIAATYRTSLGHRWRLQLMGTPMGSDEVWTGSEYINDSHFGPIHTFITGDDGILRARDGGKIVSFQRLLSKTNDRMRRKLLLV